MERRKIKDESEARRALEAIRTSGWDAATWARENGVDGRSLNAWRNNLGRGTRRPRRSGLVELVPTSAMATGGRYVVVVGDARLEFTDSCSAETLRRVVTVLRAC